MYDIYNMSDYADIQLLNCNRSSSVEGRADTIDDNGIFTNSLNQSLILEAGDQVTIEKACINSVGCGRDEPIEFQGVKIPVQNSVTYTKITKDGKVEDKNSEDYRLGYYTKFTAEEVAYPFDLQDNQANITIGYYINTSEHPEYITQPRRFVQETYNDGSSVYFGDQHTTNWTHPQIPDSGICERYPVSLENYCQADWRIAPYEFTGGSYESPEGGYSKWSVTQKLDNTRYTLFVRNYVDFAGDVSQLPDEFEDIWSDSIYYRYRELKQISVDAGFNAPSSVAEQITKQLNNEQPTEVFSIWDNAKNPTRNQLRRNITSTVTAETFKPFNCANWTDCRKDAWEDYRDSDLASTDTYRYFASMSGYIGVKRPEIWEAGRNIPLQPTISTNGDTGYVAQTKGLHGIGIYNDIIDGIDDQIVLQMEYTKPNLDALKTLFDAQALYPELWHLNNELDDFNAGGLDTGDNITIEKSRIIHINQYQSTTLLRPPDSDYIPSVAPAQQNRVLGDDAYSEGSPMQDNIGSTALFCNYDSDQKDIYYDPSNVDLGANPLLTRRTYGFAQAVKSTDTRFKPFYTIPIDSNSTPNFVWLISLDTRKLAGSGSGYPARILSETTPAGLVHNGVVIATGTNYMSMGRRCLYDYHATAFGTAILSPYTGENPFSFGWATTFNGVTGTGTTDSLSQHCALWTTAIQNSGDSTSLSNEPIIKYATQLYLGANSPQLQYDGSSNRFSFAQLHTATNTSNDRWLNGNPVLGSDDPITATESDVVYKLNPKVPLYGYSPEFKPYSSLVKVNQPMTDDAKTAEGNDSSTNHYFVDLPNQTLEQFTVFDSHGGIYIDDWGFKEKDWDNCLWNIMGFDYSQVQAPASVDNVLTKRVTAANQKSLYRITTNCDVVSTDTKSWIQNPYGGGFFTNQIPFPKCMIGYDAEHPSYYAFEIPITRTTGTITLPQQNPSITQPTSSFLVSANNLVKSMIKPYFTIHSNLLADVNAIGGGKYSVGSALPIIGICSKFSAEGDYFFADSDLIFTITKKMVLSDIQTSIRNPDGTTANVDKDCSVIYKVIRDRKAPPDLINQLLKLSKNYAKI